MCDPISIGIGLVGGAVASKVLAPKASAPAAAPAADPAAERAAAEAEAAQKANAQLAADNRRRREQGSLLAKGAPQPSFGDTSNSDGISPIGGSGQGVIGNRSVGSRIASTLLSQGAPAPAFGSSNSGSTGVKYNKLQELG